MVVSPFAIVFNSIFSTISTGTSIKALNQTNNFFIIKIFLLAYLQSTFPLEDKLGGKYYKNAIEIKIISFNDSFMCDKSFQATDCIKEKINIHDKKRFIIEEISIRKEIILVPQLLASFTNFRLIWSIGKSFFPFGSRAMPQQ